MKSVELVLCYEWRLVFKLEACTMKKARDIPGFLK
jgi:hypothetical protein